MGVGLQVWAALLYIDLMIPCFTLHFTIGLSSYTVTAPSLPARWDRVLS